MYKDHHEAQIRGVLAESLVAEMLVEAGWKVLSRNWRGEAGELDIVVIKDGALRIVEVKERSSDGVDAIESVSPSKQRRLARAAEEYLAECNIPYSEVCFIVALIYPEDMQWKVEFIDNAFDS